MKSDDADRDLRSMVAEIVAAYVGGNSLSAAQLPDVIRSVHSGLAGLIGDVEAPAEPLKPAVPIRRSVTPDFIVCLEDGRKLKMLKRHLSSTYDMTPAEYREKWGLPADYPMVAPNYSARRSEFARQIGLGRKASAEGPVAKEKKRKRAQG
jgi:predicted transcriptional regulator